MSRPSDAGLRMSSRKLRPAGLHPVTKLAPSGRKLLRSENTVAFHRIWDINKKYGISVKKGCIW